uniref:Uncharacterized protein n=1 Tax=Panagrolaimus sp. ES5 TaxID=591445 RepID=A0AC34FFP1_9BILA
MYYKEVLRSVPPPHPDAPVLAQGSMAAPPPDVEEPEVIFGLMRKLPKYIRQRDGTYANEIALENFAVEA